jgi:hypothetical protein
MDAQNYTEREHVQMKFFTTSQKSIFDEMVKSYKHYDSGIVEALVFSEKICQQILSGHEKWQVALLLCYPTFCTAG